MLARRFAVIMTALPLIAATVARAEDPLPTTRPVVAPTTRPALTPPTPPATVLSPLPPQPRDDEAMRRVMAEEIYVPPAPIPRVKPRTDVPVVKPLIDIRKTTLVKYPGGWSLVNRQGRLIRAKGESFFLFDSDDTPLQLIRNRQRETMEDLSEMGRKSVRFRISGLVTEYRGKNFLVLQMVLVERGRVDR